MRGSCRGPVPSWAPIASPTRSVETTSVGLALTQNCYQLRPGHLHLLTLCKILYRQDTGFHFVLAQQHDLSRQLVPNLERLFYPKAAIAQLYLQACATQFAGKIK